MNRPERKPRQTNYQTFYKDAIDKKEGYVTKDGRWAAVSNGGGKQFTIIHDGQQVHTCRNYDFAKAYILKNSKQKNAKRSRS